MFTFLIDCISGMENFLWTWMVWPLILSIGIYLTVRSRCAQLRYWPTALRNFYRFLKVEGASEAGVHPIKTFFASAGGFVGVSNIVTVCLTIQIGGPGALFWLWMTALVGMIVKYSELYLGVKFRVTRKDGLYDGGPMFFLRKAYPYAWIPVVAAILLALYGVEVYQFGVVTRTLSQNFGWNEYLVAGGLLGAVLFAAIGGVERVGGISGLLVPIFFLLFFVMGFWVLAHHVTEIPSLLWLVLRSAFQGHAALGGFVGGSIYLAASQGIRCACYSGDTGVGYASVIHSETRLRHPEKQAALAFVEVFLDSFLICTMSALIILVTGVWSMPVESEFLMQQALSKYFPYMNLFMPIALTLFAYSSIIAYFCVGLKCAAFLSPRFGRSVYCLYACIMLPLFSLMQTAFALKVMYTVGGMLIVINLVGIFLLRKELSFTVDLFDAETDLIGEAGAGAGAMGKGKAHCEDMGVGAGAVEVHVQRSSMESMESGSDVSIAV